MFFFLYFQLLWGVAVIIQLSAPILQLIYVIARKKCLGHAIFVEEIKVEFFTVCYLFIQLLIVWHFDWQTLRHWTEMALSNGHLHVQLHGPVMLSAFSVVRLLSLFLRVSFASVYQVTMHCRTTA